MTYEDDATDSEAYKLIAAAINEGTIESLKEHGGTYEQG